MAGNSTKAMLLSYAATVLLQSELPVPLGELFPAFKTPIGFKTLSMRDQRAIVNVLIEKGMIVSRKFHNIEFFEANIKSDALYSTSIPFNEIETHANELFGISGHEMKRNRYNAISAEREGKVHVVARALLKLISQTSPQTRNALFVAIKGKKFQERAAWTPNWQISFLERLEAIGAIKSIPGTPVTYEVSDHMLLRSISDGTAFGPNCLQSLLWPDEPCTYDHSKLHIHKNPTLDEVTKSLGEAVLNESQIGSSKIEDNEPKLSSVTLNALVSKPAQIDLEKLPEADPMLPILRLLNEQATSILGLTDLVVALAKSVSNASSQNLAIMDSISFVKSVISTVGNAVIKTEDSLGVQDQIMGGIRKRLSDLEKSSKENKETLDACYKLLKNPSPKTDSTEILNALRKEFVGAKSKKAMLPALLKKLDSTCEELGALHELTLDSLPKN